MTNSLDPTVFLLFRVLRRTAWAIMVRHRPFPYTLLVLDLVAWGGARLLVASAQSTTYGIRSDLPACPFLSTPEVTVSDSGQFNQLLSQVRRAASVVSREP